MRKVLAFDIGASSMRGVIGKSTSEEIELVEVMRYKHSINEKDGILFWDIDQILNLIKETILCHHEIDAIGISTWGVDFALLDDKGNLVQKPWSYRNKVFEEVFSNTQISDQYENYLETGTISNAITTFNQLTYFCSNYSELVSNVSHFLMMSDYLNYKLGGGMYSQKSQISTSQLLNNKHSNWNEEILGSLCLDKSCYKEILSRPKVIGSTLNSSIDGLSNYDVDIVSVTGHDTASAFRVIEIESGNDVLFVSAGTWIVVGTQTEKPIINKYLYTKGVSNEQGYDCNYLIKNLNGFWMLNRSIEEFRYAGNYADLDRKIHTVSNYAVFETDKIEYANQESILEQINLLIRTHDISNQCEKLSTLEEVAKSIYMSMAQDIIECMTIFKNVNPNLVDKIHVVGGGSQSAGFVDALSNRNNIDVKSGPKEACSLGIVMQLLSVE